MKFKIALILPLLLMVLLSCNQENNATFDFEGSSQVSIINDTDDSLRVELANWYAVPLEAQDLDTLLPPSGSLLFDLKVQGRNHYSLSLNETNYKIFTQPNAMDTVLVKGASYDSVLFLGDHKSINQFLLKSSIQSASPNANGMSRAQATHNAEDFPTVIKINDSLTQEHILFVKQNMRDIPEWYANFEIDRLHYWNIGSKINSFFYRKVMLGKSEPFPTDLAEEINTSAKAQSEDMLGNMRYMYFLDDYMHYKTDPGFSSIKPTTQKEWQDRYDSLFATVSTELTGLPKDFYLAFTISKIIETRSYILDTNWIAQVSDTTIQNFLFHRLTTREVLPEGEKVPYFYLLGLDGQHYEPEDFQDHILLINFWATWCKPCIKEFPNENSLVEKFEADPVTIVNIGINSDFDRWEKMVKKNRLTTLNLIAQDNWNDALSEKFDIKGLPHSVLIDWNGRVVQNKCPRASEGIENQIAELLDKMKTEANKVYE